ncbi:MAG: HAMP domain-containing sensor histidine kinase [Eubacteriales bacterium]|nr:HAMP domain-containing sensor histidine kinase [Eubacteriales bacterium]
MKEKKQRTLGLELLIVVLAAAVIAAFLYVALSSALSSYLDSTYGSENYYRAEDKKVIQSLEDYIDQYGVSSDDWYMLTKWADRSPVIYVTVYKDGKLKFISGENSRQELSGLSRESSYEKTIAYSVDFKDGACDVIIYGKYSTFYYSLAKVIEISVPFIIFIIIVLYSVKSKIKYINRMAADVKELGAGKRDKRVRIEGNDELALLARSINELNAAYNDKIDYINNMYAENKEILTEMSHDVRTPMTPLLVYLGMLRDKRYTDMSEHDEYVRKANEKAIQLKQMSDGMFSYFTMAHDDSAKTVKYSMNMAFYDQMSALADYLTTSGMHIDAKIQAEDVFVMINTDFVSRIFNNIASNIVKYADHGEVIQLRMFVDYDMVVLQFSNIINELADYSSSTGFGVKNIRKMMRQMGAECDIKQVQDNYTTTLKFKIVPPDSPDSEDTEKGCEDGCVS